MKIADLMPEERPREKALQKGTAALSAVELLAILIRTGPGQGRGAVDIGRELLQRAGGSVTALAGMSLEQLQQVPGIGPGKAVTIRAALELGKRLFLEGTEGGKELLINSPEAVFFRMYPRLKALDHEECWALFLTKSRLLIGEECLSSGGRFRLEMDIPILIRRALDRKAASIILVHNHPGGSPDPSQADIDMTHRIQQAFHLMDLVLLDHLILAEGCFYSFDADRRFQMLPGGGAEEENLINSKQLVTFTSNI